MWKLIGVLSLTFCLSATADETDPAQSVTVEFCGRLRDGMMAIGGECTGTTISFERIIWEVKLNSDAQRQFADKHNKDTVVVTGSLSKVSGIETKDRWVIDVKKLSELDPTKHKPGVRMAIVGQLQTADDGLNLMMIKSSKQVWTIDLTANADLKKLAQSAVNQRVMLIGNVKQPPQEDRTAQPVLKVTAIKQPPATQQSRSDKSTW